jgi:hypothetical protein
MLYGRSVEADRAGAAGPADRDISSMIDRAARHFRPAWLLAVLPAAVLLMVQVALLRPAYVDDQYIFYRYAHNWAEGLGPVFNPGEHVEGFSSSLWLLALTAGELLGLRADWVGPVLSALLGLACLVALGFAARGLLPDVRWSPLLLPLGLAIPTGFAFYSASGMDALIFAFVLLVAVLVLSGYSERLAAGAVPTGWSVAALASMAAVVLVRAEGFLYAIALSLVVPLAVSRLRAGKARTLLFLPAGTVFLVVAVFVARRAAYGEWLPATVMAKGYVTHYLLDGIRYGTGWGSFRYGLHRGVDYVGLPLFLLLAALAGTVAFHAVRGGKPPPLVLLGVTALAVNLAVTVWGAGDWMPLDRMLVPVMPLLVAVSAWCAARSVKAPGVAATVAVVVVVAVAGVHLSRLSADPPPVYDEVQALGGALAQNPGRETLVTHFAGRVAYRAGPETYVRDIFGLTDIHNATQGDYWVPTFGRTDFAYSLRGFDVLITPVLEDLNRLSRLVRARGEPSDEYLVLPGRRWTSIGMYVVVRRRTQLRSRLEVLCACRGEAIDRKSIEALRPA